ncbi:MAG: response regulator [Lentisphaeria bacterium]|nr:response regulator [Lentisphaeria bacterium]
MEKIWYGTGPGEGKGNTSAARTMTMHCLMRKSPDTKSLRGRMTAIVCTLLAVFFVLPLAVPAAEQRTVRVGYYENEVFQEGAREGAMKTGYAYEYYRKMAEYTGWKYEYVYGEYAELYQMLLDGKIDLLAGLAWKKERQGLIGYPEAPMGSESYNLVKHGNDDSITANPKTLEGKTIGVLDSALADVLNRYLAGRHVTAKVKIFKDYKDLFAEFDSGKLDVLAAEGNGASGRDNTEVLAPFGGSSYFLCVNIRRPDLLAKLNEAQSALTVEDPNFLPQLNMKYYPRTILARAFSRIERQWLKTHRTLRVGFLENYMPYSGKDAKGQVTGVVKDIIPAILTSLRITNLQVTYEGYVSYDSMITDLSAGRIDVAFPVGGGLYFAEKNGLNQTVPVTSMSVELAYKGAFMEDTTSHFAVNENNRMQHYFVLRNYPGSKVTLYPSIEACLDAVISGEATCTTLNGLRANDILKNRKYRSLYLQQLGRSDERCFGVEIGNKGLLKLLNRGLSVIGTDYVQKKSHLYMHALYSYPLKDVILDHLWLFGSLLFAVGAVIVVLLVRDIRRTRRQMAEKEAAGIRLEDTNRKLMEHTRTIERQREQESELRGQLEKKQNELEDALQMAQSANRAKTTFLSNMSHDIRTPMNAIIGFTELAERNIHDTERVREYLATIEQSSDHLLSLINDVLDMSRIESGKMTLNEKEESLPDIVHVLREIVRADVSAKKLRFRIEASDVRNEHVFCDRLRLNQLLLNLLSNAIKYTPEGGTITLAITQKPAARADRAAFEFRVRDNGIGMSEEFAKTVFEPFTREENATVSAIQGTGLGMAITKNIIEMMDGKISLTTKEGKGTEFVVALEFRTSGPETAGPVIPELKGMRCLTVTEDGHSAQNIFGMLREFGLRGESCVSGEEAVVRAEASLRDDPFAVYIVDWLLKDPDGLETARRIRKCAGNGASIFILTAYDWGDIKNDAREAGVTGFIPKTLFPSDLKKALLQFCVKADPVPANSADPAASLKDKKVLMVDDSELNLKIGVLLLQGQGMKVDTAANGQIAVDMIREKGIVAYDFILMDVQMPVMDGYQATAVLRKLPGGDKLRIIAFSANAFEEDKEKSLKAGMNGHLTKPLKIADLIREFTRITAPE